VYGLPPACDYLTWVGLALNADRARVRKLWDQVTAQKIATGSMEVPDEWATHLTDSPEEARNYRREKREMEMLYGNRSRVR